MTQNELNEKQLNSVAGGLAGERQVSVPVDIPEFNEDVTIKVYVDGQLDTSKTRTVDSSVRQIVLTFTGKGKKALEVKFNNVKSKKYDIDFDKSTYIILD